MRALSLILALARLTLVAARCAGFADLIPAVHAANSAAIEYKMEVFKFLTGPKCTLFGELVHSSDWLRHCNRPLLAACVGKNPSLFVTQTDVDRVLEEGAIHLLLRAWSCHSLLLVEQAVLARTRCAI